MYESMRQLSQPIHLVQEILGEQKKAEGTPYRVTAHCVRVEQAEGVLLYHTLTGELLLLSREEAALLEALPGPVPTALEALVPRWFLRPDGSDDMALADQMRQIAALFQKKETALTKYKIFTTTACNARCFYCFEAGWESSTMTEQTARDTAAYIAAHRGGKPVSLEWFGGEPLVNAKVIDIIIDSLRRQGVAFRSTMISNGYLFDETLARRAKNDWNLEEVHITLDGTEAVYNARKAYVNPTGSPFQRVLENIGLLLDAGVQVKVRLNMDGDNERDLYALIDQLAERFEGKPDLGVYVTLLWENTGKYPSSYTEEERCSYVKKRQSLQALIEEKGLAVRVKLKRGFVVDACLADNSSATTVMPDGKLGRCIAYRGGSIWGSIYTNDRDEEVLRQWREHKPPEAACRECVVYPQCVRLKKCPDWLEYCSPIERSFREDTLRSAVLWAYKEWKAAGQI